VTVLCASQVKYVILPASLHRDQQDSMLALIVRDVVRHFDLGWSSNACWKRQYDFELSVFCEGLSSCRPIIAQPNNPLASSLWVTLYIHRCTKSHIYGASVDCLSRSLSGSSIVKFYQRENSRLVHVPLQQERPMFDLQPVQRREAESLSSKHVKCSLEKICCFLKVLKFHAR